MSADLKWNDPGTFPIVGLCKMRNSLLGHEAYEATYIHYMKHIHIDAIKNPNHFPSPQVYSHGGSEISYV